MDGEDDDEGDTPIVPQKRKRPATIPNEGQNDNDDGTRRTRKAKINEDEKAGEEAARRLDRLAAAAAAAAKLASGPDKLVKKMMRQHNLPVPKYDPTACERRDEVNHLTKKHIKHVSPAMLANINTGRDVGGKKNKFYWSETRKEIAKDDTTAPAQQFKRWVDEEDEMVTWLIIPSSLKTVHTGKVLIPISEIVNKNPKFPEFTVTETILGAHIRTGESIIKAYKIKYEKMDEDHIKFAREVLEK
jgi:hypothetical protein